MKIFFIIYFNITHIIRIAVNGADRTDSDAMSALDAEDIIYPGFMVDNFYVFRETVFCTFLAAGSLFGINNHHEYCISFRKVSQFLHYDIITDQSLIQLA
jgi:hypothetical protein